MPLLRKAHAKINLYLHITGKRADGYHLLDSLVCFVDLHDTLSVEASQTLALNSQGPFAQDTGDPAQNLVLRAAHLLKQETGITQGARFTLQKHIPAGAGMGGGSSDAAAALHLLSELWQLHLPPAALAAMGLSLGADIPVCLYERSAYISGIGENVEPVSLPSAWLLLINPRKPLPTAAVYQGYKGAFESPARFAHVPSSATELAAMLKERGNNLQASACAIESGIIDMLDALNSEKDCLLARMSGSGATCFGLFKNEAECKSAAERLAQRHPGWWIHPASVI